MDRVLEFLDDNIASCEYGKLDVDGKFHHNAEYKDGSSIIRNGILSIKDLHNSGVRTFDEKALRVVQDHLSHINGDDGISLSVVGLNDLYRDEEEYNPFKPGRLDFIVDGIKASRTTYHYGNEYICYNSIGNDKIKAVDIRLREYLRIVSNIDDVNMAIKYYEYLREIALTLKELNLSIPIREMSNNNRLLDTDRVINMPKIKTLFK